jgi:hypothetical protein
MPRFYFDVDDGQLLARDDQGSDLPDLAAAERQASEALGDIAHDVLRSGTAMGTIAVSIRNSTGEELLVVSLTYASSGPDPHQRANAI